MTPSEKFLADLDAVCKKAKNFPVRRSDRELYGVLSACLHMVYRVDREGILEDLKTEVISRAKARGGKRPHFRGQTDAELVVGRLVFEAEKRRDATWRYTAVLREARKHQIQPPDLVSWLTHNGGGERSVPISEGCQEDPRDQDAVPARTRRAPEGRGVHPGPAGQWGRVLPRPWVRKKVIYLPSGL